MAKKSLPKPSPLALAVDELQKLQTQLAPHRAKISREETLKKAIRAAATWDADKAGIVPGVKFDAQLGPRGNERTVNAVKLSGLIGALPFAKLAKVTLAALEEAKIAPDIALQVIEEALTGHRSLTIVAKARAKAA